MVGFWDNRTIQSGCFSDMPTWTSTFQPIELQMYYSAKGIVFSASKSNEHYGASDTIMPASADMTMGLYLGRPAEV